MVRSNQHEHVVVEFFGADRVVEGVPDGRVADRVPAGTWCDERVIRFSKLACSELLGKLTCDDTLNLATERRPRRDPRRTERHVVSGSVRWTRRGARIGSRAVVDFEIDDFHRVVRCEHRVHRDEVDEDAGGNQHADLGIASYRQR